MLDFRIHVITPAMASRGNIVIHVNTSCPLLYATDDIIDNVNFALAHDVNNVVNFSQVFTRRIASIMSFQEMGHNTKRGNKGHQSHNPMGTTSNVTPILIMPIYDRT